MRKSCQFLAGSLLAVATAHSALLYNESFDYSAQLSNNDPIGTGAGGISHFSGNSTALDWVSSGLTHSALNNETGGAIFHDRDSGNRTTSSSDPSFLPLDPFTPSSPGDTFWIAGLIQYNDPGSVTVAFNNGEAVNRWGFGIDSSNNVIAVGAVGAGAATNNDTGVDAVADGSTYLFLARGTVGTGTSPTDSQLDFWFNPSDTSSVGALGGATWSTSGSGSKFGRHNGGGNDTYTTVSYSFNATSSAVDEIRFGNSFEDVIGVPEPGTLSLVGLALGSLLFARRHR